MKYNASALIPAGVARSLGTNLKTGLTEGQEVQLREKWGSNETKPPRIKAFYEHFWEAIKEKIIVRFGDFLRCSAQVW